MNQIKAIRFDTSIAAPHVAHACACIEETVKSPYVTAITDKEGDIVFCGLDCHAGEEVEKVEAMQRLQDALNVLNGTAATNRARNAQVHSVVDGGDVISAICVRYTDEHLIVTGAQCATPVLNNAEFAAWVFDRIQPKTYLPDVFEQYNKAWMEFKSTSFRDEHRAATPVDHNDRTPVAEADVFQHLLSQLELRISKSPTARYFQSPAVTATTEGTYVPIGFSDTARLATALVFAGAQEQNNDFVSIHVQCPNSRECLDAITKSLPIGRIHVRTFEPMGAVVFTQIDNMQVIPVLMTDPPQVQLSARVIKRHSVSQINPAYTMLCSESLPKLVIENAFQLYSGDTRSFGQTFGQAVPPGVPSFSNSPLLGSGMYATPVRIPTSTEIAQMLMTSSNFNQVFEALYTTTDGQNKLQAANTLMLKFIDDVILAEQKIKTQSGHPWPNGGKQQF